MQNKQTSKQTYALGGIRTRENTPKACEPGVKQIYTAEFPVDKLVVNVKHLRTASYPEVRGNSLCFVVSVV
jgi:methylmalonyl-CoA mutase cobalamin-binding subunit